MGVVDVGSVVEENSVRHAGDLQPNAIALPQDQSRLQGQLVELVLGVAGLGRVGRADAQSVDQETHFQVDELHRGREFRQSREREIIRAASGGRERSVGQIKVSSAVIDSFHFERNRDAHRREGIVFLDVEISRSGFDVDRSN